MKPGDIVLYVPHSVHARQRDRNGEFPWVFGWKTGRKEDKVTAIHGPLSGVKELDHKQTALHLKHVRRQSPSRQEIESARLVFLRPNACWNAVVRSVATDGKSACLDIHDGTTGNTLHYDDVPIDETTKQPHTCHEAQKATAEPQPAAKTAK